MTVRSLVIESESLRIEAAAALGRPYFLPQRWVGPISCYCRHRVRMPSGNVGDLVSAAAFGLNDALSAAAFGLNDALSSADGQYQCCEE